MVVSAKKPNLKDEVCKPPTSWVWFLRVSSPLKKVTVEGQTPGQYSVVINLPVFVKKLYGLLMTCSI